MSVARSVLHSVWLTLAWWVWICVVSVVMFLWICVCVSVAVCECDVVVWRYGWVGVARFV